MTTAANQPQIAIAGALIPFPGTVPGRFAIRFNGSQSMTGGAVALGISSGYVRIACLQFLAVASGTNVISDLAANSLNFKAIGDLATFNGANVTLHNPVAVNDIAVTQEIFSPFASRFVYNGTRGFYAPGTNSSGNRGIGGAAGSYGTFLCTEYFHFVNPISTYEDALIQSNVKAYWGTP